MNGIVEGEVGIDMRGGIDVDGLLNLFFFVIIIIIIIIITFL